MHFYNTPAGTDAFTRAQAELFQLRNKVSSSMGFLSFFGNPANGSQSFFTEDATNVTIDIVKPNDTISAICERGVPLGLDQKQTSGYTATTTDRMFPIIKDGGVITAADLVARQPGETNWTGSKTQEERRMQIAGNIFYTKIIGQIWKHELMASESLLTGKMTANSKGAKFDFQRNGSNTVSIATAWNSTSSTPLTDIDTLCGLVDANGLSDPDFVGMDPATYDWFLKHADVIKMADTRRYDVINIGNMPAVDAVYGRYIKAGWMPRGKLVTPTGYTVTIFTYNKAYMENGVRKLFLTKGTVFAASTGARFDRYFGPSDKLPEDLQTNSIAEKFFGIPNVQMDAMTEGNDSILDPRQLMFFARGDSDGSAIQLEVQSAPIYAPTQVDAVAVGKMTLP